MEIGFVSFNQEALNRANKVMKLLQGQGAIDELGLGRIRDAFSNMMFPGLSTLQTHAKYFLLMPALYSYLEKCRISDSREARAKVRENEVIFTQRLVDGSPEGTNGIIGADTLRSRNGYVKYDPAYVYHAGMETYHLIPHSVNIYSLLAERSALYLETPRKHRGNEDMIEDSDDLTGNRQIFKTCGENYNFNSKEPLSIALNHKEAVFLKQQIIATTSGSLLSYLLDSGLYEKANNYYFDNLDLLLRNNVPDNLYRTYRLALRYSRFAYLLRLRYAMLYDTLVGATEAAEKEYGEFNRIFTEYADEFTPESIDEIIRFVSKRVTEESCKLFIIKCACLMKEGNFDELDCQIQLREKTIKGRKRSKLLNYLELPKGKPFDSPQPMAFRWNTIVRTVLSEIKEGMINE
ncbi:MAG: hypothetical protein K2N05_11975 [Muribaculaceae bacterium]|nr:hypothetical protein [Muribaculaceae bacterium]